MQTLKTPPKHSYTEPEAAAFLGITISTLHSLLDRHVFNDGTNRPENMDLMFSDLLLLSYFLERQPELRLVPTR